MAIFDQVRHPTRVLAPRIRMKAVLKISDADVVSTRTNWDLISLMNSNTLTTQFPEQRAVVKVLIGSFKMPDRDDFPHLSYSA